MKQNFPNLMSPFKIGSLEIKNRYCVAPMAVLHFVDKDGAPSEQCIKSMTQKAKGGFGLLFHNVGMSDSVVDPPMPMNFMANPTAQAIRGAELIDSVHNYGAKIIAQISMGIGRNGPGSYAPSELPYYHIPDTKAPALTVDQIKKKIELEVKAAAMAKQIGYDGVEVHAMHFGYLLDEFAMSFMNHREDEYGGSLENRMRIVRETIEGIKQVCGSDFPVTMRLGVKSYIKGFHQATLTGEGEVGRTLEEGVRISQMLEQYGCDAINMDVGVYDSEYTLYPAPYMDKGWLLDTAKTVKDAVNIPVLLAAGRINDPVLAEKALEDGKLDAVVLGRQSWTDPALPKKVEMGVPERIRPCISCNQGCVARIQRGEDLSCAVNPTAARELSKQVTPALRPKKIAVIGAGVGGMEFAYIAKQRGHDVAIYEKSDEIGGLLIEAGHHEFKSEVDQLNKWYQNELKLLNVPIYTGKDMDPEAIKNLNVDTVVLSTGATAIMPNIPGIDNPKTVSCLDASRDKVTLGENVTVVGGGLVGCEVALHLLKSGKKVTIVEALDDLMIGGQLPAPAMNRQHLMDLFELYNANILTGHKIVEVNDQGAVVMDTTGTSKTIEADNVVMAIGLKPRKSMATQLYGSGIEVYTIGAQTCSILGSVWNAFDIAAEV